MLERRVASLLSPSPSPAAAPFFGRRHRAYGAAVRAALGLLAAFAVTPLAAQAPAPPANHARLTRDIERFQRTWRELWQRAFVQRKQVIVNLELLRGDLQYGNVTFEGRRYRSIVCSAGWIGESELAAAQANPQGGDVRYDLSTPRLSATERLVAMVASRPPGTAAPDPDAPMSFDLHTATPGVPEVLNLWSSRRVRGDFDKGQVCPQWIPPEVGLPPDEGERLDLALPVGVRPIVVRARDSLLTRLRTASLAAPTDGWITGQRVRFAIDNGDLDEARDAVATCGADERWCRTLDGLVQAAAGDLAAADLAFRAGDAASMLGTRSRCADTAAFALLPAGPRRAAHRLPCAEQGALEERIWWLADPFWSVPGNPRYVEHQVRLAQIALRSALDEDERFIWRRVAGGEALRETFVRYGWPSHTYWGGWQLDEQINKGRSRVMMEPNSPYTAKEYAPDRTALIPDWRALEQPFTAVPEDWDLVRADDADPDSWWPSEHMALLPRLFDLAPGQLALFRRDHTLRVGVAVDDPVRGLEQDVPGPLRVHWLAARAPDTIAVVADTTLEPGATLRANGDVLPGPTVLSLEVPGRAPFEVGHRRRSGFAAPPALAELPLDAVAVSEPVFMRLRTAGEPPPVDPDLVLARMAGSLNFRREAPLAVYWESYGIPVGDTADVELRIVRRDETSAARQLGARLGLVDARRDSVSIRWREPDPGRAALLVATRLPTVGRALALNIGNLVPGRYAVRVLMRRSDGVLASAEREIEVTP